MLQRDAVSGFLGLLLASLLVAGCGGGSQGTSDGSVEDGGPHDGPADMVATGNADALLEPGDPFDLASLATALAQATCRYRAQCQPVFAAFIPETTAECEATVRASTTTKWTELEPLITAGRVAFRKAEFDRCAKSYDDALLDCDLGPDPTACAAIFQGVRAAGAPCGATSECNPDHYCTRPEIGKCGKCAPRARPQGNCASAVCLAGYECLAAGSAGSMCIDARIAEGRPCGTPATGLCRGVLQCTGTAILTCQRPVKLGAACSDNGDKPTCNVYAQTACADTNVCVALTVAHAGDACGMAARTSLCDSKSRCATASSKCQPLSELNEACSDIRPCARDLYCAPGATCKATKPAETSCARDVECHTGLACVGGNCQLGRANAACE